MSSKSERNPAGIRRTPVRAAEVAAKAATLSALNATAAVLAKVDDIHRTPVHATEVATKGQSDAKAAKVSGLDAAAAVLAKAAKPMTCREIVDQMIVAKLWTTKGKTPHATIYSAMLRDIDSKPGESRFEKTGRGLFVIAKR